MGEIHSGQVVVGFKELLNCVSRESMARMFVDEVARAIQDDADLRILVREMVKDATAKMNLEELVKQAVALALKSEVLTEPAKTESKLTSYKCPLCGMVSYNPNDAKYKYCGNCHR